MVIRQLVLNDIKSKSREQRLITKEHKAMHANLINLFKPALYSSTLVIKLFESSIKLFYAEILTVKRLLLCNERQIQHYFSLLWK